MDPLMPVVVGFIALNLMREFPTLPAQSATWYAAQAYQKYGYLTLTAEVLISMQLDASEQARISVQGTPAPPS